MDDFQRGYLAGWDAAIGDGPNGLAALIIGAISGAGLVAIVLYIAGAV